MDMHQVAEPPSRQERSPLPLRLAGALAIAYWNTHGPGTGPSARRPLGAPA
ncbi:hypothetical protein ACH4LT_23585 [Streptomyces clavifer]|uniref:hypothetical protein n=1 Tax=Streptomyces clavifer TaxID=68188 RepID=UPI003789A094